MPPPAPTRSLEDGDGDAPSAAREPSRSLADQAYEALRQLIFGFVLLPGDRFSESELAERTGVSRTPLRQALQRLEREGFVDVFPKTGWRVRPLDFDQFDELYDLRVLIETHAVQRLCDAEARPRLDALAAVWLVPPAEREQSPEKVEVLDEQFHVRLVEAAGNGEMAKVHRAVTDRIRIIRRLDFTKPNRVEATYQEHAKILRAVLRRRAGDAVSLLRAHIEQSKVEVRKISLDALYRARQR